MILGSRLSVGFLAMGLTGLGSCSPVKQNAPVSPVAKQGSQHAVYLRGLLDRFEADRRLASSLRDQGTRVPCRQKEFQRTPPACPSLPAPIKELRAPQFADEFVDECTAMRLAEGFISLNGWTDDEPDVDKPLKPLPSELTECGRSCTTAQGSDCSANAMSTTCRDEMLARRRRTIQNHPSWVCSLQAVGRSYVFLFESRAKNAGDLVVHVGRCGDQLVVQEAGRLDTFGIFPLPCYASMLRRAGVEMPAPGEELR